MKKLSMAFIMLLGLYGFAQHSIDTTESFRVECEVIRNLEFSMDRLKAMASQEIGTVAITNHKGEPRSTLTAARGIPIAQLLGNLEIKGGSPKLLSESYPAFEATDGYRVVFSWNEIFNSPTGSNTFILTEADGVPLEAGKGRIVLISPKDTQTGPRYVKGLNGIIVHRVYGRIKNGPTGLL